MLLGQWRHQLILWQAVERSGGSVEFGTALASDGIVQDEDGVTATLQKTAEGTTTVEAQRFRYVVGADGAHSTS